MQTLRYAEVSALHIDPATYAKLLDLARTGPGRPRGSNYDPDNPWHSLIVEPHSYGCWVHTGIVGDGIPEGLSSSLVSILEEGFKNDAVWILFDADLLPTLDLDVFEYMSGPDRPFMR